MKAKRSIAILAMAFVSAVTVMAKDIRTVVFQVDQMHCENCERKVQNNMKFEKGLKEIKTNLKDKTVEIKYDAEKTDVAKLQAGFKKFKYEAKTVKETKEK